MNESTENLSEGIVEAASEKKPLAVCSVSFAEIVDDAEREVLMRGAKNKKAKGSNSSPFSKAVFKWRNAAAAAAIFLIGILHFTFQMSFIRGEVSENQPPRISAPAKKEPIREAAVEQVRNPEFGLEKIKDSEPGKTLPAVKKRSVEIAPSKPQLKKKESVETRAERLRRAERILTGI